MIDEYMMNIVIYWQFYIFFTLDFFYSRSNARAFN